MPSIKLFRKRQAIGKSEEKLFKVFNSRAFCVFNIIITIFARDSVAISFSKQIRCDKADEFASGKNSLHSSRIPQFANFPARLIEQ